MINQQTSIDNNQNFGGRQRFEPKTDTGRPMITLGLDSKHENLVSQA